VSILASTLALASAPLAWMTKFASILTLLASRLLALMLLAWSARMLHSDFYPLVLGFLVASPLAFDTRVDTLVLSLVDARFDKSNAVLLLPFVSKLLGCWVASTLAATLRRHSAMRLRRLDTWVLASRMLIAYFDVACFDCSSAAVFLLPFVAWLLGRFDTCFDTGCFHS
jgi:hypothetical protein